MVEVYNIALLRRPHLVNIGTSCERTTPDEQVDDMMPSRFDGGTLKHVHGVHDDACTRYKNGRRRLSRRLRRRQRD